MKQRLVGTLVLGSLALILIPLLLDGEGVERPPLATSTPPAPAFEAIAIPAPERPTILADAYSTEVPAPVDDPLPLPADAATDLTDAASADAAAEQQSAAPEPARDDPAPVPQDLPPAELAANAAPPAEPEPASVPAEAPRSVSEPALDASGLPETWAVRLGVFSTRANADRLISRLVADGYKAYARPVGVSTAVLVGPVLTQNEATALRNELNGLKAKYQTSDAIVQRYDIAQ